MNKSTQTQTQSQAQKGESKVEAKVPVRCLVIQLARLGDTLQSLMALRAAKQLYPHLEIHFLAREKFSIAAKKVPWIETVVTLPTETLLSPILSGQKNETDGLSDLAQWLAPLVQKPWDMIVNWSYSDASSYLTGLLPARVKLGYTRRSDSTFAGADGWSHYIQGIIQGDIPQNIHLTDVLTTQLLTALQIHAGDPLPEGNAPVTSKTFFSLTLTEREVSQLAGDTKKKWVALQIGAGKSEKTWDAKNWARFAQAVLERNPECGIFLLGGPEDKEREKAFKDEIALLFTDTRSLILKNALISFVGETSFDLWASLVSRSQWLVAGDTAAIHLASLLGTRVLNISIGPVRFLETGPYGNGHYVISSALDCLACKDRASGSEHTCRLDISPEAAYAVWSYASNEWIHRRQITVESHFAQLNWSNHLTSIAVHRSKIRPSQDGGGVTYEPVTKRPTRLQDWSAIVMGHIARSWYCGWVPTIGQEITREMISPPLLKNMRELAESTEVLSKICTQAIWVANSLNNRGSMLKSPNLMGIKEKEELQELGQKLLELQTLVDRLGKAQPPLLAFSQMLAIHMHHLRGNHLAEMGKETAVCYKSLSEGVAIFSSWIKYTLDLVKPVALKTANITPIDSRIKPVEKDLSP